MTDLERARKILKGGGFTCVFCKGDFTDTDSTRGVKPLLARLNDPRFENTFAADKVIGKAAAFLYVLLKVRAVHTLVISEPALAVLRQNGIEVSFDECVSAIRNRTNTGFCPMETAVWDITEPTAALTAIKEKLQQLQTK